MPILTLNGAVIDCAPGNLVTIDGSGFGTDISLGSLSLSGQSAPWLTLPTNLVPPIVIPPDDLAITPVSWTDTEITFVVPDGALSGTLTVTADDTTTATCVLRIVSQYVQASEFIGQGVDVLSLQDGELDALLRDASAYADMYMGGEVRVKQRIERYPWRRSRRVYPRRFPVASVDKFLIQVSNRQFATIDPLTIVINADNRYIEVLSYAVASYSFAQAIMNLGLTANIVLLIYTAGFSVLDTPQNIRTAVKMIATELLTYRAIQAKGFGGLSKVQQGVEDYERRTESFAVPQPALELLRPYVQMRLQ